MLKRLLPIMVLAIGVGGFWLLKATRPAPPPVTVEEREWPVAAMTLSLGRHAPTLALYGEVQAPDRLRLVASLDGHVGQRRYGMVTGSPRATCWSPWPRKTWFRW